VKRGAWSGQWGAGISNAEFRSGEARDLGVAEVGKSFRIVAISRPGSGPGPGRTVAKRLI
jgi:hypothetical protein